MNALMNTTPPGGGKPATMTSLEIAEVVNSRHDKVKQSIERLADRGAIQLPPLGEVKNHLGQSVSVYTVGERDSYVVVAQLSPEFTARLVDYWQTHRDQTPQIPTTAAALASVFQMVADAERNSIRQDAAIASIGADVEQMKQSLTILARVPANGELVTYLRKRINKEYGLSAEIINQVIDCSPYGLSAKFAVRNINEHADGSSNLGYWKREVNTVFRRFVDECTQVTPTMCTHSYVDGRFKLIKRDPDTRPPARA